MVADLGNTRLKWGQLSDSDGLGPIHNPRALAVNDINQWREAWLEDGLDRLETLWVVSSVNPNAEAHFESLANNSTIRWIRSAADVVAHLPHQLERPEATGADRALAVLAARKLHRQIGPGTVISCGTAITVEHIDQAGVWQGGAIAPGFRATAKALHELTAKLPRIDHFEPPAPPAWGRSTQPAMMAGLVWSVVGAIRELTARQHQHQHQDGELAWKVWTGGDSDWLAPLIEDQPVIMPDLVLQGLGLL